MPVGRHVGRANRWKIAWFRRKARPLIRERQKQGHVVGVQDESIVITDTRPRKGVYTRKGRRATYTFTGSYSKTVVFGMITADGEGFFERYPKFSKDEFVDFLRKAHERFGRMLIIADRAPQHRARAVREALEEMEGRVEMVFLPPGCPA